MNDDEMRRVYAQCATIAVVGCSPGWPKPSAVVPAYLQDQGYRIVPVNPNEDEVLGQPTVASLTDVAEPVDVVEVFRPAEEAPAIAREAVEMGAKVLWLQTGIVSEEARAIAEEAGLTVVMDKCLGITHGDLGLGPGVKAWKAEQEAPEP